MSDVRKSTPSGGSDISLGTLTISAVASVIVAFITSRLWAPGTLVSAAFTPVAIALIKEALVRPTRVVGEVVRQQSVARSDNEQEPEESVPDRPAATAPFARHWGKAVAFGLVAFAIAAVIVTVPEMIAGKSASGSGRGTTLFGGQPRAVQRQTPKPAKEPVSSTSTQPEGEQKSTTSNDDSDARTVTTVTTTTETLPLPTDTAGRPQATMPSPTTESTETQPPPVTETTSPPPEEPSQIVVPPQPAPADNAR